MAIKSPKKSLKNLKEAHEDMLPTHPSNAAAQVPDKLEDKRPMKKDEHEDMLPTHPSDTDASCPDDRSKLASGSSMSAKMELDGQKAADESEQDGDDVGVEIPDNRSKLAHAKMHEEKKEEKEDKEEADKEEDEKELKEHLAALVRGEVLPDEFKVKAKTLFEAAVKSSVDRRVEVATKRLEEEFEKKLSQEKENISEELVNKVDDYLDYVVEEWMKENELAIESGLRADLTEKFIVSLKETFQAHYIEIPETKEDLLEKTIQDKDALQKELNEEINRSVELKKELSSIKRDAALAKLCEELTDTQALKLKKLCEKLSFEDNEEFSHKVTVIKNHYFPQEVKTDNSTTSLVAEGGIQDNEPAKAATVSDPNIRLVSESIAKLVRR